MVDDGSQDGSSGLIRSIQKYNSRIRLVRFKENRGQTAAFAAGFKSARGKVIVTMDADLQNSPEDIPLLLEKIKEYDVVCGWRHKRNDPWIKRISSRIANSVRNKLNRGGLLVLAEEEAPMLEDAKGWARKAGFHAIAEPKHIKG